MTDNRRAHRGAYLKGGNNNTNIWRRVTAKYTETEPFLRSRQLRSYSRTSQHFTEPEGSLPCSQEPSTGPYPKPDQSSLYHPNLSL
jgi:hypothetical protein